MLRPGAGADPAVTVRLFLDVDGVVAPLSCRPDSWPDYEQEHRTPLSRQMAGRLAALPLEIVWLTTMEQGANLYISPRLGWGPLPYIKRSEYRDRPWWKFNAVLQYLRLGGGPFVWADDELATSIYGSRPYSDPPARNPLDRFKVPYLLVAPDGRAGLAPQHVDEIARFASLHTRPAGLA